jgi:hypothetical protein
VQAAFLLLERMNYRFSNDCLSQKIFAAEPRSFSDRKDKKAFNGLAIPKIFAAEPRSFFHCL